MPIHQKLQITQIRLHSWKEEPSIRQILLPRTPLGTAGVGPRAPSNEAMRHGGSTEEEEEEEEEKEEEGMYLYLGLEECEPRPRAALGRPVGGPPPRPQPA